MSLRNLLISSFFILLIQFCAYSFQTNYLYTIKGRVVDDYSKPVANATITIKSPEYDDGCIVYTYQTDENGNFIIKRQLKKLIPEWTLYAVDSSRLPENTMEILNIGSVLEDGYYKEFTGQKITVVENQITDLGDIRLQVRHYPVLLQLLDSNEKPLIYEDSDFYPYFHTRDPLGDIIQDGGTAPVHMRYADSAVMIGLPEGRWDLDVFDGNDFGIEVSQVINVNVSNEIQKITLKLKKAEMVEFEGRKKTFPYTREMARQKIEQMGFAFTQESFEKRVLNGNDKAVALFLNAGMNPNVLTKGEWFLRNSIEYPRVLKLLLEAGADVNRKVDGGWTGLMLATSTNISTVKMLLAAGADVRAKNDEGRDALYYSQINDDNPKITKLLKSYLPKKNSK